MTSKIERYNFKENAKRIGKKYLLPAAATGAAIAAAYVNRDKIKHALKPSQGTRSTREPWNLITLEDLIDFRPTQQHQREQYPPQQYPPEEQLRSHLPVHGEGVNWKKVKDFGKKYVLPAAAATAALGAAAAAYHHNKSPQEPNILDRISSGPRPVESYADLFSRRAYSPELDKLFRTYMNTRRAGLHGQGLKGGGLAKNAAIAVATSSALASIAMAHLYGAELLSDALGAQIL